VVQSLFDESQCHLANQVVTHAEAKAFAGDEAKKIKMTNNRKIVFDAAIPSVLTERTSHRCKLISLPR